MPSPSLFSDPNPIFRLCVGMPIMDSIPGECFGHHLATFIEAKKLTMERGGELLSLTPLDLSPHDNARQFIVDKALESDCTHLFFMDDDTITPRGGVYKLLQTMEGLNAKVVSGLYLRRGYPYTSVWSFEREEVVGDGNPQFFSVEADCGVHEIHSGGLGCALIDLRWMRANVPTPWFKMIQDEKRTLVTDDVTMFKAVRAAKGLILGDADVQCTHVGRREFITRSSAKPLRDVFKAHEAAGKYLRGVTDTTGPDQVTTTNFVSKEVGAM